MKNKKAKIATMILMTLILMVIILPTKVFASENENIQIVKTEEENYIIYVKDLLKSEGFKYAISEEGTTAEVDLNYINTVEDGEGNQVIFLDKSQILTEENYIYIETEEEKVVTKLNLQKAFDKLKMEKVEKITKTIPTELVSKIEQRNEIVNDIHYTETVGGIKIKDDENASYYYVAAKLPTDKFTELEELAEKINKEYEEKDMYSKIELATAFDEKMENIIKQANWKEVHQQLLTQPIDAKNGDKYVIMLKKVEANGKVTYDAKFLTSFREEKEERIPAKIEKKEVQQTSKLPITGDSIIPFVILASISIALVLVFIKIIKLQKKESKH